MHGWAFVSLGAVLLEVVRLCGGDCAAAGVSVTKACKDAIDPPKSRRGLRGGGVAGRQGWERRHRPAEKAAAGVLGQCSSGSPG